MAKVREEGIVDKEGANNGLTETYHHLMAFYANAHVPENIDDIKGTWIIDEKEKEAINTVLDMLKDCGANPESLT